MKPFLKWAGSKRWLIPHLKELYEPYTQYRYVSPFGGSGADVLGLKPNTVLLNDVNPYLIELWKWIQQDGNFTISMQNKKEYYLEARARFNELIALHKHTIFNAERAQLFWYLNRNCFNGLCRFNKQGYFNVPFGRYKNINFPTNLSDYKLLLAKYELTTGDFENVSLQSTDFLYCDPPYDVSFTNYSSKEFNWEDQIRLVKWVTTHKGVSVISNLATDRILDLYSRYGLNIYKLIEVPRYISCKKDNRKPVTEVIATYNL